MTYRPPQSEVEAQLREASYRKREAKRRMRQDPENDLWRYQYEDAREETGRLHNELLEGQR